VKQESNYLYYAKDSVMHYELSGPQYELKTVCHRMSRIPEEKGEIAPSISVEILSIRKRILHKRF
jgi:hypothetical protein